VFSRTLKSADNWRETRIASGDTAEEIAKLKAEPGKDLVAAGGTEFMHSLIKLGVVDEYRLWVLPAVTGKGAPLFPELDQPVNLRLVKARPSGPESSNWCTRQPTSRHLHLHHPRHRHRQDRRHHRTLPYEQATSDRTGCTDGRRPFRQPPT
jgi:dihydrofolate reductase